MPIFAYRCERCGFEKDVLQKRSDPPLTQCPSCGQEAFAKQLTAPAFQLKGSGWYVTDFRDNGKAAKAGEAKPAEPAAGEPKDAGAPAAAPSGGDTAPAAAAPAPATPSAGAAGPAPGAGASSQKVA